MISIASQIDGPTFVGLALLAFGVFAVWKGNARSLSPSLSIPSKRDILLWFLVNRQFVFFLYTVASAYILMFTAIPERQKAIVFYSYATVVGSYFFSQKAFGMLDFSSSKVLRPVDPREGKHKVPWVLPDSIFADMEIYGAETLQPQRSPWGTVYNVLSYDPERNVCIAAPDAAADSEELTADRSKIEEIYGHLSETARKYQVFLRIYPSLLLKDVQRVEEEVGRATQKGMFPNSTRDGEAIDDALSKIALDKEEDEEDEQDEVTELLNDLDNDRAEEVLREMNEVSTNGE